MKIVTIIGARPQFIKAATVSRQVRKQTQIREILVHTGQHYDDNMSDIFFEELDIPQPDYHLGIGSSSHGVQTGQMLAAIENVLIKEKADWVLVYGDTNSTLAGALAAVKLHIPVAHVEAGLRSFNRRMPEEINRVLTDHASDFLFAPTETAVKNLAQEGLTKVQQVGDVMYDAALYYAERAQQRSKILENLNLSAKSYLLATIHRAENTDDPKRLRAIFQGLMSIEMPVVLPLHPRTRKCLAENNLLTEVEKHLHILLPVGYLDMVMLEKNAKIVVTDSGGVQKEAFFYQVPCVTVREETEWVELVEKGFNQLIGTESIAFTIHKTLTEKVLNWNCPLYGDGKAANAVLATLSARNSTQK